MGFGITCKVMAKQFNVFISSKMQELAAERKTINELLQSLDTGLVRVRAWVFEDDAPASNASIRQVYLNALKKSALYLGLFWNEYGEWTIDEFNQATEWGIDRHIYVKNVAPERRDPRLQAFLDQQSDVVTGITPKWFTTLDELRDQIRKSIQVWLHDRLLRRPGDSSATFAEVSDDVPEQPSKLIGRADLIAEIRALLEDNTRVLLQGFGGMGKTAMAATLAAQWVDDEKGPVLWLRAGSETANTIFEALARPFDAQQAIASASGNDKIKVLRSTLTDSGITLLVLDDVWDGAALSQVVKALPKSIAVLATARQRYALDEIIEIGKLETSEALSLLGHFARRDCMADPDAHELCHQLGYHAFALEVAGKTLKVDRISPGELLKRIANAPHDIAMPEDFAEEGRSSIIELLDASLNALDEETREAFLAFGGLFVPSTTPELMARVLGQDEAKTRETLNTIQRRGLADQVKTGSSSYRIHDLAYSYARTIHSTQGGSYERTILACQAFAADHENDLELLDAEQGNVLGAARTARHLNEFEPLVAIVKALSGHYLSARGHTPPFLDLLDAAIDAAEQLGPDYTQTRLFLLGKRGNTFYDRGDLPNALKCYLQALELARKLEMRDREVLALGTIGKVRSDQGEADATNYLEEARRIAESLQDDFLLGFVLESQGYHSQSQGDYEDTRQFFSEEVALARRINDQDTEFFALVNLGTAENKLGHFEEALTQHQRALDIARHGDNRIWAAYALQALGEDYHGMNAHDEAQARFREALILFRESGLKAKVNEIEAYMRDANYPIEVN
jgi:tetratricopeptide (TPR) repeat protein